MRRYEAPNSRTVVSCVNRCIHSPGAIAVTSPMLPVMAATMAAPSQATRSARFVNGVLDAYARMLGRL